MSKVGGRKLGSGINWDIQILSRIEILKGILGDLVDKGKGHFWVVGGRVSRPMLM